MKRIIFSFDIWKIEKCLTSTSDQLSSQEKKKTKGINFGRLINQLSCVLRSMLVKAEKGMKKNTIDQIEVSMKTQQRME